MKTFIPQKLINIVLALVCIWGLECIFNGNAQAQSVTGYVAPYTYGSGSVSTKEDKCGWSKKTRCMPYCYYNHAEIAKKENCFLCPVFAVVFNTVSEINKTAVQNFSNPVKNVVLVAFAIWLAIQVLAFVSSPETRDLKDIMQSIITQGFLVVIAVVILQTGVAGFFKTFVNPVYVTGQRMAQVMFEEHVEKPIDSKCSSDNANDIGNDQEVVKGKSKFEEMITDNEDGLPQSMGVSILTTMTMMENRITKFKALGSAIMCKAWNKGYLWIFPKPIYLITGLGIWAVCMALIVGIPFLMVDAIFQLGVASALLPAAVGCFAFKSTRQYSKKVWETYLNSMFAFLFISIVVVIVLGTIKSAVTMGMGQVAPGCGSFDKMFLENGASETFFEDMVKEFGWFSPHFLRLIFVFVLAWSVMSMAKDFAGEFADSISSTSIGSSIGTMAASTAKGMTVKATKPLLKAAGGAARRAAGRMIAKPFKAGARAWRRYKNKRDRDKFEKNRHLSTATANGGRRVALDNGNTVYEEGNGALTKTTKKEKVKTENGREISKKTETVKKITTVDLTITQTTITNWKKENGEWKVASTVVREKVKFNNASAEGCIGRDGSVDVERMQKIMANLSGDAPKAVQTALVRAAAQRRISKTAHDYNRAELAKEPEIVSYDPNTGLVTIKETKKDGTVVFTSMKLNKGNDSMETEVVIVNKKGEVRTLYSDGIRNKMVETKLKDGQSVDSLGTPDAVKAAMDDKKKKVSYSYTKYWQRKIDNGLREEEVPLGEMDEREVYGARVAKDKDGNELGTILGDGTVVDKDGNVIGKRDLSGQIVNDAGETVYKSSDYKSERVGGEFSEFVRGVGNEMQKGRMEYLFN